jgi:competence protein ComGC
MPKKELKGTFWPGVRQRMYEKAIELYMYDHPETQNKPEIEELQEAGYMHTAKVLVLREMRLENKPSTQQT